MVVGGIYYKLHVARLKLCASRAFWLVAHLIRTQEHRLRDRQTKTPRCLQVNQQVGRRRLFDITHQRDDRPG